MSPMPQLVETKVGNSSISWQPINEGEQGLDHTEVYKTWTSSSFKFIEEDSQNEIPGLRPPQIGGIHAALGFIRSDETVPATIVMPTGTGKTETILSIVVAGKFERSLILVPSDPLRDQTKNKFTEFGLLRELKLIREECANPHVATIHHGINLDEELEKILQSNVIIATAQSLARFRDSSLRKLTDSCSILIIDEAHHVNAKTWARVKSFFDKKPILQFTATPFRSDLSRVEGKIIFNYPLKKAQDDGYFKPIEFHPVSEFIDEVSDECIAKKAIEILRKDLDAGLNHIMMARASSISRAESIFEIYKKEEDLKPIIINSRTTGKAKTLEKIKSLEHKIIICVNMLGEGFDLPQLKIAAIHDPHKSINILLQFTGRFTRKTQNVDTAKFIANIANPKMNDSLDLLYNEDSDWNEVISNISSRKITDEKEYQNFKERFTGSNKLLDLGVNPNISTTIYSMNNSTWLPKKFEELSNDNFQIQDSILDDDNNILVFSVKSFLPVPWTKSRELYNETWDLYIALFNREKNLLFVHSSAKDGLVKKLVNLIAKGASQVKGEQVFRSLSNIKRLKLQNVGLNKNKRGLRYSMHTGTEINEQIPDIEASRATKSNIFGKGYENGEPTSLGCSYKGKVWAMDSDSLDKWVSWCESVGSKLLDDTIDTNEILKTAMQTELLTEYPDTPCLSVDWPIDILRKNEQKIKIGSATFEENLINCELIPFYPNTSENSFCFILKCGDNDIEMTGNITGPGEVQFASSVNLSIFFGEQELRLTEYLTENPPQFYLSDTSIVDGGLRYFPTDSYEYTYPKDDIEAWDWDEIDISVESQRENKIQNSIQHHVISEIMNDYDLIFDDDGSGEVADIVAIKNIDEKELVIDLYHCKYCSKINGEAKPRSRVDDIYQVAGQAEKSVKWFSDIDELIQRLITRESSRIRSGKASRIDKGNLRDLNNFSKIARFAKIKPGITIVQPATSKAQISRDIQIVLGATATYIDEISAIKLRVIISN